MNKQKCVAVLSGVLLIFLASCQSTKNQAPERSAAEQKLRLDSSTLKIGTRLVYPYSVIPGGVGSKQEIKIAIERDRLVAEHYAGLNTGSLKQVRLQRDTTAYVSFRKDGKIYWTSRKVKLSAGEMLFLGRGKGVRGRCGNLVADEPQEPVLESNWEEPSSEVLDNPIQVPEVKQLMAYDVAGPTPAFVLDPHASVTPVVLARDRAPTALYWAPTGSVGAPGVVAIAASGSGSAVGGPSPASTPVGPPSIGSPIIPIQISVPVNIVSIGFAPPAAGSGPVQIYEFTQNVSDTNIYSTPIYYSAMNNVSYFLVSEPVVNYVTNNATNQSQTTIDTNTVPPDCHECGIQHHRPPPEILCTPEPATWVMGLVGVGLMGMGIVGRKRDRLV